jgi:hypothetical protein
MVRDSGLPADQTATAIAGQAGYRMRLLITGGRKFADRGLVWSVLDRLHGEHHFSMLIHGDARGADRLAGEWAQERGIEVLACPADRKRHGRAAATKRNRQMLAENPDLVVAFPGDSDTRHMTLIAEDAGVKVIYPEDMRELMSGDEPG